MKAVQHILFAGDNGKFICKQLVELGYTGFSMTSISQITDWFTAQINQNNNLPDIIICDANLPDGSAFSLFNMISSLPLSKHPHFIVIDQDKSLQFKTEAIKIGIDDFFSIPVNPMDLHYRISYINEIKNEQNGHINSDVLVLKNKLPFKKRMFDVLFSLTLLIILFPALALIALAIKLESSGPVFYISKRAGNKYRVFNFYKFRTMRKNADLQLAQLANLNQYQGHSAFIKINKDPRITKFGAILRNTSLDELPQLLNVLKGDMSIVGNRPLPLYEAEYLTTDDCATRFLAPAGLTGLWQVTKRGQNSMSDLERKQLDIEYARGQSWELDFKILFKTFSAMQQKESV